MTLADLVRTIPVRRDLLEAALALGSPRRVPVSSRVGTLGLGIAIGAAAALLWAPRSGRELRRLLAEQLQSAAEAGGNLGRSALATDLSSVDA